MDEEAKHGHHEPTAGAKQHIVENFKKYLISAEQQNLERQSYNLQALRKIV